MKARRSGITLVELLVVIAIIGILASLALPAIQRARESVRRVSCGSNLRQLGLAIHQYTDALGCLPPGRWPSPDPNHWNGAQRCTARYVDRGFHVFVLPYLEATDHYERFNFEVPVGFEQNRTAITKTVSGYCCPSDPGAGIVFSRNVPLYDQPPSGNGKTWRTSYFGVYGSVYTRTFPADAQCRVHPQALAQADGVLTETHPMRWSMVADGLAATMLVSERLTARFDSETAILGSSFDATWSAWWMFGDIGSTLGVATLPPNAVSTLSPVAGILFPASVSSNHDGGANVLLCDGSTRFISSAVDSWAASSVDGSPVGATFDSINGYWVNLPQRGVWQALATRAGSERSEL